MVRSSVLRACSSVVEQLTFNQLAAGSNPAGLTKITPLGL